MYQTPGMDGVPRNGHHVHPLSIYPSHRKSKPASSSRAPSRLVVQNRRARGRATDTHWETDKQTQTGPHRRALDPTRAQIMDGWMPSVPVPVSVRLSSSPSSSFPVPCGLQCDNNSRRLASMHPSTRVLARDLCQALDGEQVTTGATGPRLGWAGSHLQRKNQWIW